MVCYTFSELEAYQLVGNEDTITTDNKDQIREAAEYVIALAKRIKSQRAVVVMHQRLE